MSRPVNHRPRFLLWVRSLGWIANCDCHRGTVVELDRQMGARR